MRIIYPSRQIMRSRQWRHLEWTESNILATEFPKFRLTNQSINQLIPHIVTANCVFNVYLRPSIFFYRKFSRPHAVLILYCLHFNFFLPCLHPHHCSIHRPIPQPCRPTGRWLWKPTAIDGALCSVNWRPRRKSCRKHYWNGSVFIFYGSRMLYGYVKTQNLRIKCFFRDFSDVVWSECVRSAARRPKMDERCAE